jgi:phenylacetate-CoA ligase
LEKSQWWPWSKIKALQAEKLPSLLDHAYKTVPFYRQRFEKLGLHPKDVKGVDDLYRLPILTKGDIQKNLTQLVSNRFKQRKKIENHSGGSTGQPTKFYQDSFYKDWEQADMLRCYRMTGYQLGIRWAFLWGSDYDANAHKGCLASLKDRIIFNLIWVNTFDLTADTLLRALEQMVRWRPKIIVAYVSSIALLAKLIKDKRISGPEPKAIQTSAEVLTPATRRLIESSFNCPVFDRYGCREMGNVAHECEQHQGLHILAENNLVELVDDKGQPVKPGQPGRIVVTNLNNYTMPFIRYETGDLAEYSEQNCSCGRGLPLIRSIQGRVTDVITSPSGKLLHGEFFSHLFYKVDEIIQYRIIQKSRKSLLIQIVPAQNFQETKVFSVLRAAICQHGDPEFEIKFELHTHLPTSSSGKYRFTSSEVPVQLGLSKQSGRE